MIEEIKLVKIAAILGNEEAVNILKSEKIASFINNEMIKEANIPQNPPGGRAGGVGGWTNPMQYRGNTQGENINSSGISSAQVEQSIPQGDTNFMSDEAKNEGAKRYMAKSLMERNPVKEHLSLSEVQPQNGFDPMARNKLIDTNLDGNNLQFENPALDKQFGFKDNLRWDIHNKGLDLQGKISPYVEKLKSMRDGISGSLDNVSGSIGDKFEGIQELANAHPLATVAGAGGLGLGALGALGAGAYKSLKSPQAKTANKKIDIKGEENMSVDINLVKTAAALGNKAALESLEKVGYFNQEREVSSPGFNPMDGIKKLLNMGGGMTGQSVVGGTGGADAGALNISPDSQVTQINADALKEKALESVGTGGQDAGSLLGGIDPQTAAMLGLGAAGIGAAGYGAHKMMQGRGEPKVASAEETVSHKEAVLGILKLAEAGVAEAKDYLVATETLMPGMLDGLIK